jgi:hypothetical protein
VWRKDFARRLAAANDDQNMNKMRNNHCKSADETMMQQDEKTAPADMEASPPKSLSEAAKRALAEAKERRRARDAQTAAETPAKEIGGRDGPDPARFGDWEVKGVATDF